VRRLLAPLLLVLVAACVHRPEIERQDDPDEAARYFALKRGITADLDLNARYLAAREHIFTMRQTSVAAPAPGAGRQPRANAMTQVWQFLGPGNVGGRTRALLIDPNDSNVMYAAAVSGGVWKTTDGGASWASVTDFLPNIAVNSLAFDPADSRVQPTSQRSPARERTSSFPAFDTDWDVPAFQRKNQ